MNFNNILQQQLESFVDKEIFQNSEVQKLLELVSETYNKFETDLSQYNNLHNVTDDITGKIPVQNGLHAGHTSVLAVKEQNAETDTKPFHGDLDSDTEELNFKQNSGIIDRAFSTLIANLPIGIILLDETAKILQINNFTYRLFSLYPNNDAFLGKNLSNFEQTITKFSKITTPEFHPNKKTLPEENGRSYTIELLNGKVVECKVIHVIYNNLFNGSLITYTDTTDSIKSKEILNDKKVLTEEILDNIPADIALFDADHKYLYVNPNGIKNEEIRKWIIGKDDFDYYKLKGMDDSKAIERRALFKRAVTENTSIEWLDEHFNATRGTVFMLRRFTPYFENGNLKYVFGYAIDATDLKRYENELKRKNSELEKVNSELDTFVYSASHNLRSPLTSIKGLIDLISLDEPTGVELENYIEKINTSIGRLDSTIYDIIEYSKNSRLELVPAQINVVEQIENAFNDVKFFNKCRVHLIVNSNITASFFSDDKRFNSIAANLISNSVKYADENKPASFLKVSIELDASSCQIIFEDNGIGIPADKHQKVFEMFYRNSNKTFGSGLGLFIVKEMVDKLGGKINLESKEGVGTKVTLNIPNNFC